MSYKAELSHLERDGERSLTEQIVTSIQAAIESGELKPGEKLPPTRELAETAGINHLTAVRAYRRLRELGLVSSQVGRGTFVREAAPAALPGAREDADGTEWQRYVLPAMSESHGDRVMAEMYRHSQARGLIPLSVGYPSSELFPFEAMRKALSAALERHDSRALQYTDIAGLPDLVEQLAVLSAERGAPEDPKDLIVTSGARQGLTLAARAVLRPGDAVACEAPTFMGVLESVKSIDTRVLPVPMDADGLDLDALESLLGREEIRFLAVQPRCHNPTGLDLAPARRARLLELSRRHGFFIVEDGIYGDLRFEGEDPGTLRERGAPVADARPAPGRERADDGSGAQRGHLRPRRGHAPRGVAPDPHAPLLRLPRARAADRGHQAPGTGDPLPGQASPRERGAADRVGTGGSSGRCRRRAWPADRQLPRGRAWALRPEGRPWRRT
jgi:DNA-binding transcriptional MocR family regulator